MSETMLKNEDFAYFAYCTKRLEQKRLKIKKQQRFFRNILKKIDKELYKAEMVLLHFVTRLLRFMVISILKSPLYTMRAIVWSYRNRPTRKEFLVEFALVLGHFPVILGFAGYFILVSEPQVDGTEIKGQLLSTLTGFHQERFEQLPITDVSSEYALTPEIQKLRQPGGEIYELARVMYGESVGEGTLGQLSTAGSVFERVERADFPNTILEVLYQPYSNGWGCQYNSVCDDLNENMDSEMGQHILNLATKAWVDYHNGTFEHPMDGAHSFCTPRACAMHWEYFGGLKYLGTLGNHGWYG